MGEEYFNLKKKLEELGYRHTLPVESVPLVECLVADLLQTTRSLRHYMELSKDALKQRDSLMMEAEPYRCENVKLIQENNQLHKELIDMKEVLDKQIKENKRKIKLLTDDLMKKESTIIKLQHDLKDSSLRGLCADTQSSRNKSKRKDAGDVTTKCTCAESKTSYLEKDVEELNRQIFDLEQKNEEYCDEIALLQNQVQHRDNEIVRLNIMLKSGRSTTSLSKDYCRNNCSAKYQEQTKQLVELENTNELLKQEIEKGLEKQHEAMIRALNLADKNKRLQDELRKVDTLALGVEEDCNKRLALMMNDINYLQTKLDDMISRNSELENELEKQKLTLPEMEKYQESLNNVTKEKEALQNEIKDLVELNKKLQDTIQLQTKDENENRPNQKCATRDELQMLLENERKKCEKRIIDIQTKLTETMNNFNKHLARCNNRNSPNVSPNRKVPTNEENAFVKHLHKKLCDSEQKILMLKQEINEYKLKSDSQAQGDKLNYKDIINQLNTENAELSKENIFLSQQLSQYKISGNHSNNDSLKREIQTLKHEIESLKQRIQILKKDKQEYNLRYKEAVEMTDKLKRDLAYKQKEIEHLEEENCSYKMSNRTGKASADHLRDECHFLREQIKKMQSDVIKEKTLASQIKNIQLETERSSNEIQNELLCTQKKLHLSKDTIEGLENKCKELQSEIVSLKNEKCNLIDSIKKLDQERDKLVIELDHKVENMCVLEHKLKTQGYEMSKLENELSELKRKLNINKVAEHKLTDNEAQIAFLNGEISRLQQKLDSAIIENKQLQNSLADANGTLKLTKIEYEKSRNKVDGLKQQLQHYVAEIRRIEELLSQKEAERSDMLEHFASLSVEANILENTNHSLESESASKTCQLQSYITKIQNLETKLQDKENIIDSQSNRIAALTCKVTSLENEIKLIAEEKAIHEHNIASLKQMCNSLTNEHANLSSGMGDTGSEIILYENRIKALNKAKAQLEVENDEFKSKLMTTEHLLSNTRREIVDLKLALQDATSETQSLKECLGRMENNQFRQTASMSIREELELPLMLEETVHEASQEDDEDSPHEVRKRYFKYSHTTL